ncbi:MAG: aldo/keto reductase [Propionibacteriaceae bacterium]|jgi:predicted oxidoreductase|nr:aldo/keto reductase [Propionibacteriaceae bacterium]
MKTLALPNTPLTAPQIVAGMMRINTKTAAQIQELVDSALEVGINFFDHANVYGGYEHECEELFAKALKWTPAQREQMILQTKFGIVSKDGPYFDFSYAELIRAAEGSLKALRTDYIDIILLHRPDALVEPEEVARAFDELHAAGKVRHFGVSNQTPGQLELLRRTVRQPLIANQVQLSITHAPLIAQGVAMNMAGLDQSVSRDLGLIEYARLNDIVLQAWSPFQAGFFTGPFIGNPEYAELNAVIDRLAAKYGVPAEAIATAWILRHPAKWQVVLGTTSPTRLQAAAAGADVELTKPEWYELYRAAGHLVP